MQRFPVPGSDSEYVVHSSCHCTNRYNVMSIFGFRIYLPKLKKGAILQPLLS